MNATEYEKILSALLTVSRVLEANQGNLNPADIRIRCLVNITAKEATRAMQEARPDGWASANSPSSSPTAISSGSSF